MKPTKPSRVRPYRLSFDISSSSFEEKEAMARRIDSARRLLKSAGCGTIDNYSMMCKLLDAVESQYGGGSIASETRVPEVKTFLRDGGVYTGDTSPDDQALFVGERQCFKDLVIGLQSPCVCGMVLHPWSLDSLTQQKHVLRAVFYCHRCRRSKRIWSSSRVFAGRHLANQKMVHAFTCAGILPSQYIHFSRFAGLGTVGHWYIRRVYHNGGYMEIVGDRSERSMQAAVDEVKVLPHYSSDGEWVITDARHDSTANAYHTTVPCLSGSTHRIVGISTLSRSEHTIAQTREMECTKVVLPQVAGRGLRIAEVAHDMQTQVARYVKDLGHVNSYDTWHGTKNVAKELKKVTEGRVRDRGLTWFPELTDKRRSIKIHLYWSMKNCGRDQEVLRRLILNIPNHYKGDHSNCHSTSTCHVPSYCPSKQLITGVAAEEQLIAHLKATYVYRNADAFCRCRDTYAVESFNHQLLIYLPKRIHFSDKTFNMRMQLAVMDWNENVHRAHTSESKGMDLRRPDRRTAMKALVGKSFSFVDVLWDGYISRNKADLSEMEDDDESVVEDDLGAGFDWQSDGLLLPLEGGAGGEEQEDEEAEEEEEEGTGY